MKTISVTIFWKWMVCICILLIISCHSVQAQSGSFLLMYPSPTNSHFTDDNGVLRIGNTGRLVLGIPMGFQSSSPKFHIWDNSGVGLTHPLFKSELRTIAGTFQASIEQLTMLNDTLFGLYQKSSVGLLNYFQDDLQIGYTKIKSGRDGEFGINIIGIRPFSFWMTNGIQKGFSKIPLIIYPDSIYAQNKLITSTIRLTSNFGFGKILASDASGNGVWTDPMNFHDDDWLISSFSVVDPGKSIVQILHMNEKYEAVGIGTDRPQAKLDVQGNLRVSSLCSAENVQMVVSGPSGILSLQELSSGDNLGNHIATQNINLNGNFLSGDGTNSGIFFNPQGYLGIGTNSPLAPVDILSTRNNNLYLRSTGAQTSTFWASNDLNSYGIGVDSDGTGYLSSNKSTPRKIMYFYDGRVGIGAPPIAGSHTLYVVGGITTVEVTVKLQRDWSDYVFNENYCLKPLCELEKFVKDNKHLPDVPSAENVKEKGIELGEMNTILLKKIEELTLYVIDQNKKIEDLQSQLNTLKRK